MNVMISTKQLTITSMGWKNLKIFIKLLISSGVVLIFSVIIGLIGMFELHRINKNTSSIAQYNLPVIKNSISIDKSWSKLINDIDNYNYSGDSYFSEEVFLQINKINYAISKIKEIADLANLSKEIKLQINTLEKDIEEYKLLFEKYQNEVEQSEQLIKSFSKKKNELIISLSGNNKNLLLQRDIYSIADFINEIRINRLPTKFKELPVLLQRVKENSRNTSFIEEIDNFLDIANKYSGFYVGARKNELKATEKSDAILSSAAGISAVLLDAFTENSEITNEITENATFYLILSILIVLILGFLFAFYTGRSITSPLKESVKFAKAIASGNLTTKIKAEGKDEVGQLVNALNSIVEEINVVIGNLKNSANQIFQAGEELTARSQNLANGANEQAASSEEMAASIEEISATINQNFENAKGTKEIAKKSAQDIVEGTESAKKAITSMNQIVDKVNIIGEIAFRTNLLALNAAVEAARAGESGKGFSVVASEVGKLADRSKLAAIEIEKVSNQTVKVSSIAGNKLEKVVPEIEKTARLIDEITISNKEQIVGINQINNSIGELTKVTQDNVSTSELVAGNAIRLMSQAQGLIDTISFFKTESDDLLFENNLGYSTKKDSSSFDSEKDIRKSNDNLEKQKDNSKLKGISIDLSNESNNDDEFERF